MKYEIVAECMNGLYLNQISQLEQHRLIKNDVVMRWCCATLPQIILIFNIIYLQIARQKKYKTLAEIYFIIL